MAKFGHAWGSKQDAQKVHQNTCTQLKQHINSTCMKYNGNSAGEQARRAELIVILQNAVDKMLDEDAGLIGDRPAFNTGDDV